MNHCDCSFVQESVLPTDTKSQGLRDEALAAIRSEPRIGPHFKPVSLEIAEDGTATIEAEVRNVALKRLALERLAATPGVSAIVDRVRVAPAMAMSDDGILDHLRKAFYDEPSFRQLAIKQREDGKLTSVRDAFEDRRGEIELEVCDGVVVLNGRVPGLASKRLAGVLAWWVPGSRDVVNGIAVEPPEEDAPIRIEEAVRIVLDKDPFVDASEVRVGVRNRTVRLTGSVHSSEARDAAEWDAWYVFGVDDVINEIEIVP
jgi:osmotically-inducible protein OsmY